MSWAHRAALAVQLGRADELRRLCLEMQAAGFEAEAGLLHNYALLLERPSADRQRLLAEVTRMLRAALASRRPLTRAPSKEAGAPGALSVRSDEQAESQGSVVPLAVLAICESRRAGR